MFVYFFNILCLEFVLCVDFFLFIRSLFLCIICSANILFDLYEIFKMFMIFILNKIIYYVLIRLYFSKGVVVIVYINNKIYCFIYFLRFGLLFV